MNSQRVLNPNPNAHMADLYKPVEHRTPEAASVLDLFNRATKTIQGQRRETAASTQSRSQMLDCEWSKIVEALKALQARVLSNPKVLAFTISERSRSAACHLQDSNQQRPYIIHVQRKHFNPAQAGWDDAIYMFKPGNESLRFDNCEALIREFATTLAIRIA